MTNLIKSAIITIRDIMKKIVIFGGGTSLSQLLKGFKLFPVDVTAVVTVADNGKSTGSLRKDYNIPAVGDISKVLVSMADIDDDVRDLLNYRFEKSESLCPHSIKNLILTALLDLKGDFNNALPVMTKLFDVKGSILPLTEDNVDLVALTTDGEKLVGEAEITNSNSKKERIMYDKDVIINKKVIDSLDEADLIIFSAGSLLTSVIPHLLSEELNEAIRKSKAEKMYICNLFTQPGETDNFTVSDHVKLLESYLGEDSIDIVVANNDLMNNNLVKKYNCIEQKDPVKLDTDKLINMNKKLILDKLYCIEDDYFRHDSLKTAYLVFSYLMDGKTYDFHN
jgi:uncharacterized cofD-like protein